MNGSIVRKSLGCFCTFLLVMMSKLATKNWLARHRKDRFVKDARSQGYRSRAAFKLSQIDQKYRLIHAGMRVFEFGSAPGGWSQWASKKIFSSKKKHVLSKAKYVACDLLPMPPVENVSFVQGDFCDDATLLEVKALFGDPIHIDLILSDAAPDLTGVSVVDQSSMLAILEVLLDFAQEALAKEGKILMKAFQGECLETCLKRARSFCSSVNVLKPEASRGSSKEVYVLGVC